MYAKYIHKGRIILEKNIETLIHVYTQPQYINTVMCNLVWITQYDKLDKFNLIWTVNCQNPNSTTTQLNLT